MTKIRLGLIIFIAVCLSVFSPRPRHNHVLGAKTSSASSSPKIISPLPLPLPVNNASPPEITATSGLALEPESQTILFEKNPFQKLHPASLTKLMTALVIVENLPLDKTVSVNSTQEGGSSMGLVEGEKITIENLLWGLLLNSGNDAADALAQSFPNGYNAFIEATNQKAWELNLKNTHFINPQGAEDPQHYSCASDLALLTQEFLKNNLLATMVKTKHKIVTSAPVDRWHHLENTNSLLGEVNGVEGVKTGYTKEAKQCLISIVNRNGKKLLVIILGSEDRAEDTKKLIDWAYSNFKW